ncbi:MAG: signal peptidase II [Candidatus Omnitrophica bacterium]|nr:signal peptidase II [Candidatus Omnitrophota bacterium]
MRPRSALIAGALIALDQATKFLASSNLKLNETIPILKGVFHITLIHNSGAAFGMFKGMLPVFILLSILTIFIIVLNSRKLRSSSLYLKAGLLLILAGTTGNLIDRLRFGYVIDFIDIRFWSVFNVADTTITIGGALLAYHIMMSIKDKSKNAPDII